MKFSCNARILNALHDEPQRHRRKGLLWSSSGSEKVRSSAGELHVSPLKLNVSICAGGAHSCTSSESTAAQRVKGAQSPAGEQHGKTFRAESCSLCSPNADRKNLVSLYKQEAQVAPSEVVEKAEQRDKMFQDSTKKKQLILNKHEIIDIKRLKKNNES